ncbi:MAG: hypothetical protein U9P70_00045 [Patescibacteria group bacterium]|nr:hypothetical protein [Patescibacteria group bacterium]
MKKYIIHILLVWLFLSIFITFAAYTGNTKLHWIDVPTHFVAGIIITAIIFTICKNNFKKTIALSFLIFISWEFFEITIANLSEREFLINLFKETKFDITQDIIMDTLGLALFFSVYKKRSAKIKKYTQ